MEKCQSNHIRDSSYFLQFNGFLFYSYCSTVSLFEIKLLFRSWHDHYENLHIMRTKPWTIWTERSVITINIEFQGRVGHPAFWTRKVIFMVTMHPGIHTLHLICMYSTESGGSCKVSRSARSLTTLKRAEVSGSLTHSLNWDTLISRGY